MVNDNLPTTPFLHKMDRLIAWSIIFTFVSAVGSIVIDMINNHYGLKVATVVNTWFFLSQTVVYLLATGFLFGPPLIEYYKVKNADKYVGPTDRPSARPFDQMSRRYAIESKPICLCRARRATIAFLTHPIFAIIVVRFVACTSQASHLAGHG